MAKGKNLIGKGRYDLQFRGTECRNCGHLLHVEDKYCPNCSQANSTKKLVLKDFVQEFLSGIINYDSKLLKTLYAMLLKPGSITQDYINGKRIAYTNPFRFLFSLAFLYFLMISYNNNNIKELDNLELDKKIRKTGPLSYNFDADNNPTDTLNIQDTAAEAIAQLDSLQEKEALDVLGMQGLDTLKTIFSQELKKEAYKDSLMLADPRGYFKQLRKTDSGSLSKRFEFFFTFLRRDSIKTYREAQEKYGVPPAWRNKLAFNGAKGSLKAIAQPGTYLSNLMAKLPLVIFLFLPVFTIFIYLAYIRKKHTYTDHLIFSFHNQSLLFILLILSWIIGLIFKKDFTWIAITAFSIYLFQAMRKFYSQGILKTIIKYFFLNTVFILLALFCATLLFTGSIFTY